MAIRLQKQSVTDQTITLGTGEQHSHVLGPELKLTNCELIIACSSFRSVIVTDVEMENCRVVTKKPLKNWQHWCSARIRNSTFLGTFIGNDFGHWEDQSRFGSIEGCDFSQAILHECRLFGCDVSSMKFAPWPTFVIVDPCRHKSELQAANWPEELELWAELVPDEEPIVSASVCNADRIVAEDGGSAAGLHDVLASLPFVIGSK
jgi:hypothetical protein